MGIDWVRTNAMDGVMLDDMSSACSGFNEFRVHGFLRQTSETKDEGYSSHVSSSWGSVARVWRPAYHLVPPFDTSTVAIATALVIKCVVCNCGLPDGSCSVYDYSKGPNNRPPPPDEPSPRTRSHLIPDGCVRCLCGCLDLLPRGPFPKGGKALLVP